MICFHVYNLFDIVERTLDLEQVIYHLFVTFSKLLNLSKPILSFVLKNYSTNPLQLHED